MKRPIHKFSYGYELIRRYFSLFFRVFYKKITIVGENNIPVDKPIIFTINHQNALMDALTVIGAVKGQTVFMARADIFQSKFFAKILRFIKILPIFRIRDGVKNLQNNEAIFEEAIGILEAKRRLAILPEGSHLGERRLRVLKKGVARIAFQAEERHNFELDIHIVPIGLDYSNYINFGSNLLVNIGEPFPIKNYKELYLENPQKGMSVFLKELRERMKPQMLNIDDSESYDELKDIKDIYIQHLLAKRKLRNNHLKILTRSQQITDKLIEFKNINSDSFDKLGSVAKDVKVLIKKLGIRYWVPARKKYSLIGIILRYLLLVLMLPIFILGFTINFLPFYLPVVASTKIKDPQFVSSVRFGASMFSFLIFYLVYLILLLIFVTPWYLAIGILVGALLIGIVSAKYYIFFKKTRTKLKVNIWNSNKNSDWLELINSWDTVVEDTSKILSK